MVLGSIPSRPTILRTAKRPRSGRPEAVRHSDCSGGSALAGLIARALLALGDAGRLPAAVAQVVELGAADGAAALHFDRLDVGADGREHPLHALAEADLSDREGLHHAFAGAGDAHALE